MKRFAILLSAALAVLVTGQSVQAGWGDLHYGGYQPWWNIFAHRNRGMTVEEQRLQRFWHDYYDAMRRYYDSLDNIDWVSYYKNHGYVINNGCAGSGGPCGGPQRIQFAPVFVSPTMNWAVPNSSLIGPPHAPMGPPPGMFPGGGHPHVGHYPPQPGGHQSFYRGSTQNQYPVNYQQQQQHHRGSYQYPANYQQQQQQYHRGSYQYPAKYNQGSYYRGSSPYLQPYEQAYRYRQQQRYPFAH